MLRSTGKQAASAALQKKGATQQPSPQQGTTGAAKLAGDIGRADSTKGGDASAMKLFDHFCADVFGVPPSSDLDPSYLEDGGLEQLARAYAVWLAKTNIPKNFEKYLDDSTLVPTTYLKGASLNQYLSKALTFLKKICPNDSLWDDDDDRLAEFSGASFLKACQRSQQQKSDTFGQEAKLALYRNARHGDGETTAAPPHWMNLVNVEDVAKNMLRETKIGDDAAGLAAKRLAVVLTKHGVGRGGDRKGFKAANVLDPRASCGTSTGALKCWSELIWNDFRSRNPDFQPLTNASNSIQVINTLNQQSTFLSQCMNELADVKRQNILLQSLIEEEREGRKKIVSFINKMGSIYKMPQSPPPPKKRKTGNNESAASTPTPSGLSAQLEIEKNYNDVDADQLHGGTALHNIISGAYKQGLLNDGFNFSGLERPGRFTDNAKYNHCLDLLDAVVEDDEKEFLCKKGHSDQALEDKVRSISRRALDLLKRLEGNPEKGNHTDGYTGVGSRAQKIKTGRGVSSMKEAMERNKQSSLESHFIRKSGGSK